jgi:hypothetical protein
MPFRGEPVYWLMMQMTDHEGCALVDNTRPVIV